jgi:hypothetical protein
MSSFIVLAAKGEVKAATLGPFEAGNIELAISKALKRTKSPTMIGSWSWQKYTLYLYGYKEGRKGTENTHELLAPHDELVLYGDAVIIASIDNNNESPISFTPENYKKFYNSKGGGDIADGDDDDEEDDDEHELDDEEEEEEDYEEEEAVDDEEVAADVGGNYDEEDEEVRPMLRIKSSSTFKKIAKWMHSPELSAEDYVL